MPTILGAGLDRRKAKKFQVIGADRSLIDADKRYNFPTVEDAFVFFLCSMRHVAVGPRPDWLRTIPHPMGDLPRAGKPTFPDGKNANVITDSRTLFFRNDNDGSCASFKSLIVDDS